MFLQHTAETISCAETVQTECRNTISADRMQTGCRQDADRTQKQIIFAETHGAETVQKQCRQGWCRNEFSENKYIISRLQTECRQTRKKCRQKTQTECRQSRKKCRQSQANMSDNDENFEHFRSRNAQKYPLTIRIKMIRNRLGAKPTLSRIPNPFEYIETWNSVEWFRNWAETNSNQRNMEMHFWMKETRECEWMKFDDPSALSNGDFVTVTFGDDAIVIDAATPDKVSTTVDTTLCVTSEESESNLPRFLQRPLIGQLYYSRRKDDNREISEYLARNNLKNLRTGRKYTSIRNDIVPMLTEMRCLENKYETDGDAPDWFRYGISSMAIKHIHIFNACQRDETFMDKWDYHPPPKDGWGRGGKMAACIMAAREITESFVDRDLSKKQKQGRKAKATKVSNTEDTEDTEDATGQLPRHRQTPSAWHMLVHALRQGIRQRREDLPSQKKLRMTDFPRFKK